MESHIPLKRCPPQAGFKSGTARSVGQHLTYRAIGAPSSSEGEWSHLERRSDSGNFILASFLSGVNS